MPIKMKVQGLGPVQKAEDGRWRFNHGDARVDVVVPEEYQTALDILYRAEYQELVARNLGRKPGVGAPLLWDGPQLGDNVRSFNKSQTVNAHQSAIVHSFDASGWLLIKGIGLYLANVTTGIPTGFWSLEVRQNGSQVYTLHEMILWGTLDVFWIVPAGLIEFRVINNDTQGANIIVAATCWERAPMIGGK